MKSQLLATIVCFFWLCCYARRRLITEVNESAWIPEDVQRRKLFPSNVKVVDPEHHRVGALPGLKAGSNIVNYAGHITINEKKGANIFYWLFEKPENPLDGSSRLILKFHALFSVIEIN